MISQRDISPVFSHGSTRLATSTFRSPSVTLGGASTGDKISILLPNNKRQAHFTARLKLRGKKPTITCSSFLNSLVGLHFALLPLYTCTNLDGARARLQSDLRASCDLLVVLPAARGEAPPPSAPPYCIIFAPCLLT